MFGNSHSGTLRPQVWEIERPQVWEIVPEMDYTQKILYFLTFSKQCEGGVLSWIWVDCCYNLHLRVACSTRYLENIFAGRL